ncbi:hypothetical protein [Streptomyces sp. NPDC005004]
MRSSPLACLPSVFCLASASVLLPLSPSAAHAATAGCAPTGDGRTFPLATRIHGGPNSYVAGGDFGTWYIDLTNTSKVACTGVHPVVVLVDERRALKPAQPRMDFYDGSRARAVRFVSTDEQELIGVLEGEGFGGFTVAPGKTVSVEVRLALAADAALEQVTANAAVIQRKGDDGDWVGESNVYRFGITDEERGEEEVPSAPVSSSAPAVPSAPAIPSTPAVPPTPAVPSAPTGVPLVPTGSAGPGQDGTGTPEPKASGTASPRTPVSPLTPAPTHTGTESPGPTLYPTTPRPTPTAKAPGTAETAAPDIPSTSDDVTEPEDAGTPDDTETSDGTDTTWDPEGSEDPELAATGPTPTGPLLAAASTLLALGAVAFLIARRHPRTHPRRRH